MSDERAAIESAGLKQISRRPKQSAWLVVACAILLHCASLRAQSPAPTPPMGWSAWDAYGAGVTEEEFRANAAVLATLRRYGWQYAMLDYGWYIDDPSRRPANFALDANGRLLPAVNRFPSTAHGAGFKPLADWLHARGLKLGIHVMLGIPRQAVSGNLAIAGSDYRAAEAADTAQTCSWDREFYVAKDNPAGQAYYDSLARLYAAWGVDLIKLGCVSDHPFHASEIRQMSEAIRRTGRPIVVELSPGPLPANFVPEANRYAQMWRIAPEHWDVWATPPGKNGFPVGLREEFDLLAQAEHEVRKGSWVDPDLLANGWLAPRPAWGEPRHSRLSEDEQRSEFILWTLARSPLIEGANLTRLDTSTRALMTDRVLLRIDQQARLSQPIALARLPEVRVWKALTQDGRVYVAIFNLNDHPTEVQATWSELGLQSDERAARDEENGRRLPRSDHLVVRLAAHASAVYEIR